MNSFIALRPLREQPDIEPGIVAHEFGSLLAQESRLAGCLGKTAFDTPEAVYGQFSNPANFGTRGQILGLRMWTSCRN